MSLGLIAAELEFALSRVSITELLTWADSRTAPTGSSKKGGEEASRLGENAAYLGNI